MGRYDKFGFDNHGCQWYMKSTLIPMKHQSLAWKMMIKSCLKCNNYLDVGILGGWRGLPLSTILIVCVICTMQKIVHQGKMKKLSMGKQLWKESYHKGLIPLNESWIDKILLAKGWI